MILNDDWCAIRYDVAIINNETWERIEQQTMYFVHFKDNGGELGARVIEGWALSYRQIHA